MITIYWAYRGLKRGLYPALNMFMVFFLPLLITLNYYDVLFNVVGRIAPESPPAIRESISFMAMYLITFFVFVYFCIWLCAEVMRLHKTIDAVGGLVFGVASGVVCCGVLVMFWFAMPFAERSFSLDEGQMFYPPHRLTMRMTNAVARRIEGDRPFIGERFVRDLRYGLPHQPTLGTGFYVSSIPTGCRVFVDLSGYSPMKFLEEIKKRLAYPDMEITPSERARPFSEKRRSPVFIPGEQNSALVALVLDEVPSDLKDLDADKMFLHDGEIYYTKERLADRLFFIKIYRVQRSSGVASAIGLFQPQKPELWDRMESLLPSRNCFPFTDSEAVTRMMQHGASNEEANRLVPQLKRGGKAWFMGFKDKPPYVAEILPGGQIDVREAPTPNLERAKQEQGQDRYY